MDYSQVEIDGGYVKGEIRSNDLNKESYYSFKGVPYARPPVGSLRFQPPKRVKKWDGVIQCTEDKDMGVQKMLFTDPPNYGGSEDCLYLNIYFPAENPNKSLRPVMVFIHGGGFTGGSSDSNIYGPDFLVAKGAVLVTLNYRLNIFGFLNLGIKECPGNVGLLDQRAALIWVKKHIKKFSGNPENVTLFGESAGSASVYYHLLSPLSKGLYHKAIVQSGCPIDPWAYMDAALSIDRGFRVGKALGCKTTDIKELYEFLLNVPANTLGEIIFSVLTPEETAAGLSFPFVPSKEIVGAYKDRFLPDDPRTLLSNVAHVPILCGLNSAEGLLLYIESPKTLSKILRDMDSALDRRFPGDLIALSTNVSRLETAKSKVRQFYSRGDLASDSIVANSYADFFGDISFGRGNYQMMKSHLSSSMPKPLYLYFFDFESKASLVRALGNLPNFLKGACHGDDIVYLFNCGLISSSMLSSEVHIRVIENMTTIWTNFAKFGNPNGELKINWKPISPDNVSHCKIDTEFKVQPGFIHEDRIKFWNNLRLSMLSESKL